ncbi:MAG: hypothetical protein ACRDPY_46745 [Streptosporangiaceae bacterium]
MFEYLVDTCGAAPGSMTGNVAPVAAGVRGVDLTRSAAEEVS